MPRPKNLNEDKLFELIKIHLIPDLTRSEQYDSYDCTSKLYKMIIELKCRNRHFDDLLIEKKKYDSLINSGYKHIRYICSTPNGIYSFNLNELNEPEWIVSRCKKDTQFSDGNTYISKIIGLFNIKDSINILEFFN